MIPITRPYFDEKEIKNISECLKSGWVTQGPYTERFEETFKKFHSSEYAYAVSSCTAALHVAMLSLGIGEGDEVIVPAYTWITSASCVEYVGAKVRFVDVDKYSYNIDVKKIEEVITNNTRAIIVVHLFGYSAEMDEIMSIAQKYNLYVVEDCACAVGTTYKGRPVGTIGDMGCFSFHPRKAVTTGEGGMCTTNSEVLANKIKQYRNHGVNTLKTTPDFGKPYYMGVYDDVGYNLRLSDIQAAMGVAQLEKLEMLLLDRKRSALRYCELLKDDDLLCLPEIKEENGHTFQSFVIRVADGERSTRNRIMEKMHEAGIQSRPGTIAIHRTEFNMNKYKTRSFDYPNASICEDTSITLPIFPFMRNEDIEYVVKVLKESL